jgi:hypothetical protein
MIILESVAGIPGLVGAMVRVSVCARAKRRDEAAGCTNREGRPPPPWAGQVVRRGGGQRCSRVLQRLATLCACAWPAAGAPLLTRALPFALSPLPPT